MIWLYTGIALGGFWFGNILTAAVYVVGDKTNNFEIMDALADRIRYISAFLAALFIGIGIVW